MLVISRREVETLVDLNQLGMAMARALADLSAGTASTQPPARTSLTDYAGSLATGAAYVPSSRILVARVVADYPEAQGQASRQVMLMAIDPATGRPLAMIDGTWLTAVRCAAGSALATRLLAREDASVLAVIGTGPVAQAHLRVMSRVKQWDEVRVAGRDPRKADALADGLSLELGATIQAAESYEQALDGADVVCTATRSPEPVVDRAWLRPGAHVNSVGVAPDGREIDERTVADAVVVVDSREAVLAGPEAGGPNDLTWPVRDGVITPDHIHAEMGELVTEQRRGRSSPDQITLYKSAGNAVQDAAAVGLVYAGAIRHRQGVEVGLE